MSSLLPNESKDRRNNVRNRIDSDAFRYQVCCQRFGEADDGTFSSGIVNHIARAPKGHDRRCVYNAARNMSIPQLGKLKD